MPEIRVNWWCHGVLGFVLGMAALFAGGCASRPSGGEHVYRRLEPQTGRVLHGAGQDRKTFREYYDLMGQTRPTIYMTYYNLDGLKARRFNRLKQGLDNYQDGFVIPQIGLAMAFDGHPEKHYEQDVAAGKYDAQIEELCRGLIALDRPVFLRLGYEFNGQWNGYQPRSFKAAWIRVVSAIRRHNLDQVAVVWCFSAAAMDSDFMAYYPGDGYVDWWGIDLFHPRELSSPATLKFLNRAREHQFPVMIGECTPRRVGVLDGQASWDQWYAPFFRLIHEQSNIKAFCYINWDWAKTKDWSDWGNARVQDNPIVLENYRREMADPRYFHASSQADTLGELGLPQPTTQPSTCPTTIPVRADKQQ